MFKKIAAEALGLERHRCHHRTQKFGSVDADDYLFHEDGEKSSSSSKARKTNTASPTRAHPCGWRLGGVVQTLHQAVRIRQQPHREREHRNRWHARHGCGAEVQHRWRGLFHRCAQELHRTAQRHLQGTHHDWPPPACRRGVLRQRHAGTDATASMYKIGSATSNEAVIAPTTSC